MVGRFLEGRATLAGAGISLTSCLGSVQSTPGGRSDVGAAAGVPLAAGAAGVAGALDVELVVPELLLEDDEAEVLLLVAALLPAAAVVSPLGEPFALLVSPID